MEERGAWQAAVHGSQGAGCSLATEQQQWGMGRLKSPLSLDLFNEGLNSAVERTPGFPPCSL